MRQLTLRRSIHRGAQSASPEIEAAPIMPLYLEPWWLVSELESYSAIERGWFKLHKSSTCPEAVDGFTDRGPI
ncbi:hypothetical protein ABIE89_000512 [Bradyrhizobium niftali]|uniref:hypothetical protein n=1 Tax=Bradyrhizobium niftali TaxID=2560055 RepID=UPI0038391819